MRRCVSATPTGTALLGARTAATLRTVTQAKRAPARLLRPTGPGDRVASDDDRDPPGCSLTICPIRCVFRFRCNFGLRYSKSLRSFDYPGGVTGHLVELLDHDFRRGYRRIEHDHGARRIIGYRCFKDSRNPLEDDLRGRRAASARHPFDSEPYVGRICRNCDHRSRDCSRFRLDRVRGRTAQWADSSSAYQSECTGQDQLRTNHSWLSLFAVTILGRIDQLSTEPTSTKWDRWRR